jgi:signal transduction histidine kinase
VLKIYLWFFLFVNVPFAGLLFGQTPIISNFRYQTFTDQNGLPQNSVKSIAGDNHGFIWLATEGGLARFDGQRFFMFNNTNTGVKSNRFFLFQSSLKVTKSTPGSDQGVFYAAADGNDFVRIENGRAVADHDYFKKYVERLPFFDEGYTATYLATGLPSYLSKQARPDHYIIVAGSGKGDFYLCSPGSVSFYHNWKSSGPVRYGSDNLWSLFATGGRLFCLNSNSEVTAIREKSVTRLKIYGDILTNPAYDAAKNDVRILWNSTSEQVFLYLNNNLYMLHPPDKAGMKTSLLVENLDISKKSIQSIYFDKKNLRLFLGSLTQGLTVLSQRPFETLSTRVGEMDNVFYAQAQFNEETILTPTGILIGKDKKTSKVFNRMVPGLNSENPADKRGILKDPSGNFWIKGQNSTLFCYSPDGSKLRRRFDLGDEIKTIFLDRNGFLWAGLKSKGLYKLDVNDSNSRPQMMIGEALRDISYIMSQKNDRLLVGTEHGLFELDSANRNFRLFPETKNVFIKSIYTPKAGQIWLTTADSGLMLYLDSHFTQFPLDKNGYIAQSHCIIEDELGFFWVPTNKGLFKISKNDLLDYAGKKSVDSRSFHGKVNREAPADLFYQFYNQEDGFLTNEFNGGCQPCALKLSNGYISLPSLNGLVWFKPGAINSSLPNGQILIDRISHSKGELLPEGDTIAMPLNARQIKFEMSTPYYGNADNLHLYYALSPVGSRPNAADWVPLNKSDPSFILTSISSGNYILYLGKLNGFGKNNFDSKKIYITVPPFWYETWWVRAALLLLLVAAIYAYVRFRLAKIRKENLALEITIAKRTRKLDQTLTELEISKNEISSQLNLMSKLITSITHDIQSPLNYIEMSSEAIPDLIASGNVSEAVKLSGLIKDSSGNMSIMLKNLLEYIKAQVLGKGMKFESINLNQLVTAKFLIFKDAIGARNNTFVNDVPLQMFVNSDYQMLGIIIHNLLDNAAKFTKNGEIRASAYNIGDEICLLISNNGIPVSSDLIKLINQDELEASQIESTAKGRIGVGLFMIKEISVLLNLKLRVQQTGRTEFSIVF